MAGRLGVLLGKAFIRDGIQPRDVMIWRVNATTGRIECHLTTDPHEIAQWLSRPWIERAGLILAAAQQSRFGMRGPFR